MAISLLLGMLATGCTLLQSHPTRWALPTVESGLGQGRWVQSLTVERRGRTLDLMAVIESDGKVFTLVGLSPMGQRLVRIIWENGKVWQESDPSIPIPIDGEAILRDFVFVNWPEQALAPSFLKTNWRPTFNGANRSLSWGNRRWLSVRPDTLENQVRVVVDHIVEDYKIYIITLDPEAS